MADSTFSGDGRLKVGFNGTGDMDDAQAVAVQSNGNLVVVGWSLSPIVNK